MGAVLAVWGRLSSQLGAQVAPGGGAGRCPQPPASDAQAGQGVCRGPVPRPEPRPARGGALHTETLFITRPEVALWEQLVGALAPSLWRVRARGRCQGDAGALALSGPREMVLAAKVALSELLIRVGRGVPPAGRFFQLRPGLSLFLGQGDGAGLRVGAVVRLGAEAGRDGASVSRQRVLSGRGAPHSCLEARCPPGAEGLAAGALLLALEAAAQAGVASVALCADAAGAWLAEALVGAVEAFARGCPPAPLRSVSVVAADGALLAAFHQACAKRWPPGPSRQELLGNVLRAQERVSTRVVTGPLASQKTEALVLPVVLEADGPEWWPPELRALAEAALGAAGPGKALAPGKVLTVPGATLPELHCRALFLVRLDGAALRQHGASKVVRQMVRSCLCSVYGAFLESVSFPLLGAGQALPAMLEEISHFLEHQPNPWMKLVQIVCPPALPAPGLVAEALSSPAEAVGFCRPELPLFLRYLEESPAARREFESGLEAAGYGFRACPRWGILLFWAGAGPAEPGGWEAAFGSVRRRYVVHREGREELLEALAAEPSLAAGFPSVRVYDKETLVGLAGEMEPLLQRLAVRAFQRQLVSQACPAEPLPRWLLVQAAVEKELPSPHVTMELREEAPASVIFQGPRRQVAQLENRCQQLLRAFQVLPVPVSPLQARFIQQRREDVFTPRFLLDRGIAAVLELPGDAPGTEPAGDLPMGLAPAEDISVAGLEQEALQRAAELLGALVGCRTVPIEEGVRWATGGQEWAALLAELGARRDLALHCAASREQLAVAGFQPALGQAEAAVREYLRNNSPAERRLDVPRPELAEAGAELLRLVDWEPLPVTVQLQPGSRALSLVLQGLRRHLEPASRAVLADLASLGLGTVPVPGRALGEYLREEGAPLLRDLAQQLRCVVSLRGTPPNGPCGAPRKVPSAPRKHQNVQMGPPEGLALRVLGREPDVDRLKATVAGFVAQFHDESVCNAELGAVGAAGLREIGRAEYRFPLGLRCLPGNVLRVRGARDDVATALAAVHAGIQAAQRRRVEAEVLYGLVKWQRLGPAGWLPFDVATSQRLETAFAGGRPRAQVEWDGQRAEVDLRKAEGVVQGIGAPVRLRREICLWERSLAPHWEPMGEAPVRLVALAEDSPEHREVAEGFTRTAPGCSILRIERVQNRALWVSYCWQRRWMEEKHPPGRRVERVLYHGTLPENRRSIQALGLRVTCRKVGIYGQGLYFAAEAGRAASYTKPDTRGRRFLFQVRVLTGEFTLGKEHMVLPPEKPGGDGRYDSVVNVVSRPNIFVTFFDDLSYPEYLITFRAPSHP